MKHYHFEAAFNKLILTSTRFLACEQVLVDLAVLQSVSYIAGALGVCVAAFYYAMVLREQRRNMKLTLETRRIGLIDNVTTRLVTDNNMNNFLELMNYEWKDYDDFEKKYGSDNNVSSSAKRFSLSITYSSMGSMLRKGMVEAEDLYDLGVQGAIFLWGKYKSVIGENRRRFNGLDYLRDFEYLAGEMMRVKLVRDPTFKVPEAFYKYIPDK